MSFGRSSLVVCLIICRAVVAFAAGEQPIVASVELSPRDAPVLEAVDHGLITQNVRIRWTMIGPGPGKQGDALYAFCEPWRVREPGKPENTPIMFWVDLATGKTHEHFPFKGSGKRAQTVPAMPGLPGEETMDAATTPVWIWKEALSSATGPDRKLYVGTEDGCVVRFHPDRDVFEEVVSLKNERCISVAFSKKKVLWILAETRGYARRWKLYRHDVVLGLDEIGFVSKEERRLNRIGGDEVCLYYLGGKDVRDVHAVSVAGGSAVARRLFEDMRVDRIFLHDLDIMPWCEVIATRKLVSERMFFRLEGGRAVRLKKRPDPAVIAKKRGYDLRLALDLAPPTISVAERGGEPKLIKIAYSRALHDVTKCILLSSDGRKLYGTGFPAAMAWEFDTEAGVLRRHGHDYNWYQMIQDGDRIYACGYMFVKLMRWNPELPWSFSYRAHYYGKKPYPAMESVWGGRDGNPEMIGSFRLLEGTNAVRPCGFAKGGDGRYYIGAHTMGLPGQSSGGVRVTLPFGTMGVRYSGVLYWYDPVADTVGYVLNEGVFEHHAIRCISAVGGRYIAIGTKFGPSRFEPPPPKEIAGGLLLLYDTQDHKFVYCSKVFDRGLMFLTEADAGILVGYGYGIDGQAALFTFDVKRRQMIRYVKLSTRPAFSPYGYCNRFVRGPDGKVYFYSADKQNNLALFRFDTRTGVVEPVGRGKGLTDWKARGLPGLGAPFAFGRDRVYFGTDHLYSVAVEQIVGQKKGARK